MWNKSRFTQEMPVLLILTRIGGDAQTIAMAKLRE